MTRTGLKLVGGISAYLAPRLAMDKKLPPIGPMVYDVTRANFGHKKAQIAARIRYQMRGRIAQDADLDDLLDLHDALEEIGENEDMETGEDRRLRGRGRGRDQEPNDPFGGGGGGYPGSQINGSAASTGYGENVDLYNDQDPGCSDPGHGLDEEEDDYWKEEDDEERRREQVANSTGSEAIDRRIAMNRDRQRRAGDRRKATIDRMRQIVRDAMSARDTEVPGLNTGVTQSSVLEPEAPEIDARRTGGMDKRRVTGDAALNSRSKMYSHMRRIGTDALAYSSNNIGNSAPNFGNGASADFIRRNPWAARVKI
jgi:hypothetical protein